MVQRSDLLGSFDLGSPNIFKLGEEYFTFVEIVAEYLRSVLWSKLKKKKKNSVEIKDKFKYYFD